jgi:hypothetical protein
MGLLLLLPVASPHAWKHSHHSDQSKPCSQMEVPACMACVVVWRLITADRGLISCISGKLPAASRAAMSRHGQYASRLTALPFCHRLTQCNGNKPMRLKEGHPIQTQPGTGICKRERLAAGHDGNEKRSACCSVR